MYCKRCDKHHVWSEEERKNLVSDKIWIYKLTLGGLSIL